MLVIQYVLRAKNVGADREPIWNLVITFHIARYLAPPFPGPVPSYSNNCTVTCKITTIFLTRGQIH